VVEMNFLSEKAPAIVLDAGLIDGFGISSLIKQGAISEGHES
jgi:hypothetical protein